jgi:hypothetical protein
MSLSSGPKLALTASVADGVGCGGAVSAFADRVIAIVVTGVAVTPALVCAESDCTGGALADRLGAAAALAASAAAVAAACFLRRPSLSHSLHGGAGAKLQPKFVLVRRLRRWVVCGRAREADCARHIVNGAFEERDAAGQPIALGVQRPNPGLPGSAFRIPIE